MDRWLIIACALLLCGGLLAIGASASGLMGHYDAKWFVILGGAISVLVVFATDRNRRKDE